MSSPAALAAYSFRLMSTFRLTTGIAFCLALGACTFPHPPSPEILLPPETQSGNVQTEGDGGESAPEPDVISPALLTGALLPERLLENGILEIGNRDAPHTLLLITEHHCGYCEDFLSELLPKVLKQEVHDGLLRLSIAILPLKKYPGSMEGAVAMLCAAKQGKGWPMHQLLFRKTSMDRSSLLSYARELTLEEGIFAACLDDPKMMQILENQQAWMRNFHVSVVPTYFIDGEKFTGLPYPADFEGQIADHLRE